MQELEEEKDVKSNDYIFYVTYKSIYDLTNIVYDIIKEIADEADYKNCFIEADARCDELNLTW